MEIWSHHYQVLGLGTVGSAFVAAIPLFTLLLLLGMLRKPAHIAAVSGLTATILLALLVYGMPLTLVMSATAYGAVFGLFPICWIVFWAIALYRVVVEANQFDVIKDSIASLTPDRGMQALLVAFTFGAFLEGAAGFGTPVAVAAAMLAGLGFAPLQAAALCLLANTSPVAFGSLGIPVVTLAGVTGLPQIELSGMVGRICAPISVFLPAYLIAVMLGWSSLIRLIPAVLVCGISFASVQYLVSRYLGPQLVDILSSVITMVMLVLLLRVWTPRAAQGQASTVKSPGRAALRAWMPYGLLVLFVFLWGMGPVQRGLAGVSVSIPWPGLHEQVLRVPPVAASGTPYAALFNFNWLAASGTACMFATLLSAALLGMGPSKIVSVLRVTALQLRLPVLTISSVLGMAFLMNYCGATGTLGLAFATTGIAFPFFSTLLGWLGVFLTGSDTSANALFGSLQVITAERLGLDPVLMAAANSSGGVMGKMISLQTIAVAAAATGMKDTEQAKLFRLTAGHSVLLVCVMGLLVLVYAYR